MSGFLDIESTDRRSGDCLPRLTRFCCSRKFPETYFSVICFTTTSVDCLTLGELSKDELKINAQEKTLENRYNHTSCHFSSENHEGFKGNI